MINYIIKNWTFFVAFAPAIAYIYDKFYIFWNDKKKKQHAYNRTFVAVVKLFYSYQKHKYLYKEIPYFNFTNEIYSIITKHSDTFDFDLESFKESILKESEIIPEISIESHIFFEIADRIRIMDRMNLTEGAIDLSYEEKLMAKRALFHSVDEIFDDFFSDMIKKLSKHANVDKDFLNKLSYYGTEEYDKENKHIQIEIMSKYLKSLYRQGAFSKEEFENLSLNYLKIENK